MGGTAAPRTVPARLSVGLSAVGGGRVAGCTAGRVSVVHASPSHRRSNAGSAGSAYQPLSGLGGDVMIDSPIQANDSAAPIPGGNHSAAYRQGLSPSLRDPSPATHRAAPSTRSIR